MTVIYAWPPLKARASMLTDEMPVRQSRGIFSGTDWGSSAGPRRLLVRLTVSSLAGNRDGAGLCQSLNRLLDGGINLVRLPLPAVNRCLDGATPTNPLDWTYDSDPLDWTYDSDPLLWFSGPVRAATVTTLHGFPALALTGLVPGVLICRAFEVIRVWDGHDDEGASRAVTTVFADASGNAVIPLHEALPAGIVSTGASATAVFRVTSMQGADQPVGADWYYTWSLREVLAGEIPEGTTEVDPWA